MNENPNNPGKDQKGPDETKKQDDELDIGNELSLGSVSGQGISDFDPEKDSPETEEQEYREGRGGGDDQLSDDNGINPTPAEVDPKNTEHSSDIHVENADEDKLNPYPDELKTNNEDEEEKLNSTWMISGRNRKI